jgi:hypothetical protein
MSFSISLHRIGPAARVSGRHRAAVAPPSVADKERVLARFESSTGSVSATEQALLLVSSGARQRIEWAAIASATWSADSLTLRLWPNGNHSPALLRLAADKRLAAVVRERVEYQRLLSVPVQLPHGLTGRVLALRDGAGVRWRVLADASLETPELRRACELAIAEIRSLSGL